ncbi:sensor histidine kinase [Dyadobacter sp. NIV53]|uniref:sensor histidine kinase n=1 Tax=Dyadobacter sp. NIV53 TaxID=2861765 RepID=UPI001E5B0AF1|nr:ATP-binding protein [Dyadobacter sp. NIV53]
MKTILTSFFLGLSLIQVLAQDTTLTLTTKMFNSDQLINLSAMQGWVFKAGHNPDWAKSNTNSANWRSFKPVDISAKDADKNGRFEGWFRLKLRLDSTFNGMSLQAQNGSWVATEVYVDGRRLASFGNTGTNGQPYKDHYFIYQPSIPIQLVPGQVHLVAVHMVDYVSPFSYYSGPKLKSEIFEGTRLIVQLAGPNNSSIALSLLKTDVGYATLWFVTWLLVTICFWLLSWLNFAEKHTIRLLAAVGTFASISNLGRLLFFVNSSFTVFFGQFFIIIICAWLTLSLVMLALMNIFGYRIKRRWSTLLILASIAGAELDRYVADDSVISVAILAQQISILYLIISSWKRLHGAQWAIVVGALSTFVSASVYAVFVFTNISFDFNLLYTILLLGLPISFLIYIALRFKEILTEVRNKADAIVRMTEEKRAILETQNQLLEQQVEARTTELKASQTQLIQKEKLASLGELTAGIAHEIQNPLNFVNNFSEVSNDLVEELKEEALAGHTDDVLAIADDLAQNLQKISHHGGRASSIVKGMLEHSRTGTGERQPTDLNALADEYLRLAYHGLRRSEGRIPGDPAKDQTFNADLKTDFDPNLSRVNVVPQEMGRVLLNLYNNAFYAVKERGALGKGRGLDYQPTVWVSTKLVDKHVEIRVRDNGTGIPEWVKAKIFQPFFTTKPTGEGTGLGLSLSYDIITKGHGGTIELNSVEGDGTTFIIKLPINIL